MKRMFFPKGQLEAIQREREADVAVAVVDIPARCRVLDQEESTLNDIFWGEYALLHRHTPVSLILMDERNALRVRARRLRDKYVRMRDKE